MHSKLETTSLIKVKYMKQYFYYSFSKILHLTKKQGNPFYSASIALGLIWAIDVLSLSELLFFNGQYPNPISIIVAFIVFLSLFLSFRKQNYRKMKKPTGYPKFFKPTFIIQVILTILGFGWFFMRYAFL